MSYAASALVGLVVGIMQCLMPAPTPNQPDQQKVEVHGSQTSSK
jgi:hypothetical protein